MKLKKGVVKRKISKINRGKKIINNIKPKNFNVIASSKNSKFAILESNSKKIFTTQFHPEVFHTKNGKKLFSN